MKIELTEDEAHLISEFCEATAYVGIERDAIANVAENCGILEKTGTEGLDDMLESIFNKTKLSKEK